LITLIPHEEDAVIDRHWRTLGLEANR